MTGQISGLLVLDFDGEKGQQTYEAVLARNMGEFPTATVRTGNGRHLLFKHPGSEIKNRVKLTSLPGTDLRSDGGFIVAPPSMHASGVAYSWESEALTPKELPEYLVGAIKGSEDGSDDKHGVLDESILEGGRNSALFREGSRMRSYGAGEGEICERLTEINEQQCSPPLARAEVVGIAKNAAGYPAGKSKAVVRGLDDNPMYWFKFNTRNWFADPRVLYLPDQQKAWLVALWAGLWNGKGVLPNDLEKLYFLVRPTCRFEEFCAECADVLNNCFEFDEERGVWTDPFLTAEWQKQAKISEERKVSGKKGAEARYGKTKEQAA